MSSLVESKNEWCARLVNILSPAVIEGLCSIFKEALELCLDNDEEEKYLMTFQTFLTRIPKWNHNIIADERSRIEKSTSCGYLEELISCVHIIQLKALTCVRVGQKQKKIDIDIPSVDVFIHKVYTNVAREVYTNVYLFERNCTALTTQRHNRELELIVKEGIMNTIRNTMPVETILKAYIDETEEVNVDIKEEIIEEPINNENNETPNTALEEDVVSEEGVVVQKTDSVAVSNTEVAATNTEVAVPNTTIAVPNTEVALPNTMVVAVPNTTVAMPNTEVAAAQNTAVAVPNVLSNIHTPFPDTPNVEETETSPNIGISFSNTDLTQDTMGNETLVSAPKTIERLERIAMETAEKRKDEDDDDYDDYDDDKLTIGDSVELNSIETGALDDIEVIV